MDSPTPFDRASHVYNTEAFEEIIQDIIRFFKGTPVMPLPPKKGFVGPGVYAIYYTGEFCLYEQIAKSNSKRLVLPIYVGKAVPRGWRQGRLENNDKKSKVLYHRLCDHAHSIEAANNLNIEDFCCRFMILENAATNLIGTVEAAMIRLCHPLWNSCIDGFGNHTPGSGRYNQAKSDWDVLHPDDHGQICARANVPQLLILNRKSKFI